MNARPTSAFRELCLLEFRLFLREPYAVFFAVIFPILLLLVFGSAFGTFEADPGFRVVDVFVPSLVATIAAYIGLVGIPIVFAEYRELNILRRYMVSPLPLNTLFGAQVAVQGATLAAAAVLVVVITKLVFGLRFGGNYLQFLGVALLCVAAMYSAGFAFAAVITKIRTAQAVGAAVFFPLLFTSGATVPRQQFPEWLQTVTDYLPLTHVVDTLTAAWVGREFGSEEWYSLATLAWILLVSLLVARSRFKWE